MTHLRQYIRRMLKEQAQDIVPGAKVIFMAGAPGSGKSTVLRQLNLLSRFEVVNPDDWYEPFLEESGIPLDIAGFTQQYFDLSRAIRHGKEEGLDTTELEVAKAELKPTMSTNMKLFNRARKLAKERAAELSQQGKDFVIDGTGGNYREISKLKAAYEGMGYSTAMVYVTVPMETSIERNFQRGEGNCSDSSYTDQESCEAAGGTWEPGGRRLHQTAVERSWKGVDTNRGPYEELFGDNFFYVDNSGTYEDYQDNIELIRDQVQGFLLTEKAVRGKNKDKRLLYHINKYRPARPQPKMKYMQDWDPDKIDPKDGEPGTFVKVPGSNNWDRWWLDSPVESGVFLTPNPLDIAINHGRSGHVYAYRVPEWVIDKSGGMHRYDHGSELLIPEDVWNDAGDEIEFLGKSMSKEELWEKMDSPAYGPGHHRKANKPSWMSDEELKQWKKGQSKFNLSGLRATRHPEDVIKMLTADEQRKAIEAIEAKKEDVPGFVEKGPRDKKGIVVPPFGQQLDKKDKELLAMLKKHLKESQLRETISQILLREQDEKEQRDFADTFNAIKKFMFEEDIVQYMADVWDRVSDDVVEAIAKSGINRDVEEFTAGALEGAEDQAEGIYKPDTPARYEVFFQEDPDYVMGYQWGWFRGKEWDGETVPQDVIDNFIETQIEEYKQQATQEITLDVLYTVYDNVSPNRILRKVYYAIADAYEEGGIKDAITKGVPIALTVAFIETLDQAVIPLLCLKFGIPPVTNVVGLGEIVYPIVMPMFGGKESMDIVGDYQERTGDEELLEVRHFIRQTLLERANFKLQGNSEYFRVNLPSIGYAEGGSNLRFKECQADVDAIMQMPEYLEAEERYRSDPKNTWGDGSPKRFSPRFFDVTNAWIKNPDNRGKGHGKEIYKAFIDQAIEYSRSYGGVFVGAHKCVMGSGTSEDAQRVWNSLRRDYTSSGMVIFIGL